PFGRGRLRRLLVVRWFPVSHGGAYLGLTRPVGLDTAILEVGEDRGQRILEIVNSVGCLSPLAGQIAELAASPTSAGLFLLCGIRQHRAERLEAFAHLIQGLPEVV